MTRDASTFELALPERQGGSPAWRWLYEALRQEILVGRLKSGSRLPATRDLSRQYGLSRGTVVSAFDQLKAEGYLEGQVGSGTYVSRTLPDTLLQVSPAAATGMPSANRFRGKLASYGRRAKLFSGYESRPTRAFRPNLPALDLFPMELWAQITGQFLRRAPTRALMGCDPMGYWPLRKAVADYLSSSRGVRCSAEQTVIVSGAQEALDIVARLFLDPGDRVCMENPSYTGAAMVFEASGARVHHVPLDQDGIMVNRLPQRDVRLIYVTPGHQFPMGTTMSLARRLALLEWAERSHALIFEDDYDSEYRYAGRPVPALQGLDRRGSVLYAGTFSKVLFPALRLGYMVVPEPLAERVQAVKSITNRHASLLDQAVLHAFIAEGHFARHVRRMRSVYAERLGMLLNEAHNRLEGLLTITGVEAGLQTVGWLGVNLDEDLVAAAAAKRGVDVTPLSHYTQGKLPRQGLQLGFAAVNNREIKRGVESLAQALEGLLKPHRRDSKKG